jgi:branched-chain amino acid transport system ATP-binding protein
MCPAPLQDEPAWRALVQACVDYLRPFRPCGPVEFEFIRSEGAFFLLDEPSMGLAPQVVEEIFEIVKHLNQQEGVSFLIAEQNTTVALRYSDYGYILENGRVVMEGSAQELAASEDVKEFYLGIASGERKSFRDVKQYRRRKSWLV